MLTKFLMEKVIILSDFLSNKEVAFTYFAVNGKSPLRKQINYYGQISSIIYQKPVEIKVILSIIVLHQ